MDVHCKVILDTCWSRVECYSVDGKHPSKVPASEVGPWKALWKVMELKVIFLLKTKQYTIFMVFISCVCICMVYVCVHVCADM